MNVFTRRNALVGFVALKVLERRMRRKRRRARRTLAVGIGVVSLGALAGLAVLLLRRHRGEPLPESVGETDDEIVGEVVTASPEPIPAT
ncbi:MAG TPA: hypothetical protein VK926_05465 [Gaiellaceae bacterium]|nr:hypothetical protein [Gaiellaceae bacterium]